MDGSITINAKTIIFCFIDLLRSHSVCVYRFIRYWLRVLSMFHSFNDNVGSLAFVKGKSMQPTLNPSGEKSLLKSDVLYVNKWIVKKNKYTRGAVYLFTYSFVLLCDDEWVMMSYFYRSPTEPDKLYIKRLIAIEGDLIRTDNNHLVCII